MSYVTLTLKIEEDDIREYLSNYYDEEYLDNMNMADEASECVSGVLSNHFSDYAVIDKNTLMIGDWD